MKVTENLTEAPKYSGEDEMDADLRRSISGLRKLARHYGAHRKKTYLQGALIARKRSSETNRTRSNYSQRPRPVARDQSS